MNEVWTLASPSSFDNKGDLIIVGKYRGETIFGETTLTAQGSSYDTFIWKLTPP